MEQILVFSGTTEGNALVRALRAYPVHVDAQCCDRIRRGFGSTCENTEVVRGRMGSGTDAELSSGRNSITLGPRCDPSVRPHRHGKHPRGMQGGSSRIYPMSAGEPGTGGGVCICREYCGSGDIFGGDNRQYPAHNGKQGITGIHKIKRVPQPMLCESSFYKRGGGKKHRAWFRGETSAGDAGTVFKGNEQSDDRSCGCKIRCDERNRKSRRISGKAGGGKENGACLVVIRKPEEDGKKAEEIIAWFREHL